MVTRQPKPDQNEEGTRAGRRGGSEQPNILIDFPKRPGVQQVSLSPGDLVKRSEAALDKAGDAIRAMAKRVTDSLAELDVRPQEIEVEFGLTFDMEAGVLVSKAGVEASVTVTLSWKSTE